MSRFGGGGTLRRRYSTLDYLIHAPSFIRLFWRLFTDRRVGIAPKAVLVAGIAYFVCPLDLIPDFPLVGLGYLDDIIVLYGAAWLFIRLCPKNVVAEHVQLIDDGA
jgi:uncharacterized membrane protein YkvA (DUF1232 family)